MGETRNRFRVVLLGGAASVAILAACGTERAPSADAQDNLSSSASWMAVGDEIIAARTSLGDRPNVHFSTFPPSLTEPVDVTEPGTYDLVAGPVPADASLEALAVSLPPDAVGRSFELDPATPLGMGAHLIERDGQTFAVVPMKVSEVQSPYAGLRAWFQ